MSATTRAAGFVLAAVALTPSPALAGTSAVYGGTTSAQAPIVVNADKKAAKLRSVIVSWRASCDDGRRFPLSGRLTAVKKQPGFQPDANELATTRNGNGRFAGSQHAVFDLGDAAGVLEATYAAKLSKTRASGTLDATVTVLDKATGNTVATCRTGSVRFSATRAPGRVFAGSTTQDDPIVVRVDAKRRMVADLLFSWQSSTCKPDDIGVSLDEGFRNDFPISGGRFGDTFEANYTLDGGGSGKETYDIVGRVARTRASGSIQINLTETDAAGATTVACESGVVRWNAVTG